MIRLATNKIRALFDNLHFDNWPVLLLQRTFFRRWPLVVHYRNNIVALIDFDGGDQCGTRICLTTDMYERHFVHLDKSRPLRVLDLGANSGGFPLALLQAGFALSRVVCVEMNRQTWLRLHFNLHYNLSHGARALNAALAGRRGVAQVAASRGGTSESLYGVAKDTPTEEVNLVTFDDLVATHFGGEDKDVIDVCKMDVEGAEYEVLTSGQCEALRRVRCLIIEIHPNEKTSEAELLGQIASYGFKQVEDLEAKEQNVFCMVNAQAGSRVS